MFSHVGFNFKVTDMQAALGLAQLERLEGFGERRRHNFARLQEALTPLEDRLVLPRALPEADPSWFGYPFTLRDGSSDERPRPPALPARAQDRQPPAARREPHAAAGIPRGASTASSGSLDNADRVTEATVWVGCYPGLSDEMVDWIAESIAAFVAERG